MVRMRFTLRDLFIALTVFCIALAAMVALRGHAHDFIVPVFGMSVCFLLLGQRKVGLTIAFSFLASWLIVSGMELLSSIELG
jgi:hypothetical protein